MAATAFAASFLTTFRNTGVAPRTFPDGVVTDKDLLARIVASAAKKVERSPTRTRKLDLG